MQTERQYVPHAVTGKPVPVLTPEEQAEQRAQMAAHPAVYVSRFRCHCGDEYKFIKGHWLYLGDGLNVECRKGHRSMLRFIPETFGGS